VRLWPPVVGRRHIEFDIHPRALDPDFVNTDRAESLLGEKGDPFTFSHHPPLLDHDLPSQEDVEFAKYLQSTLFQTGGENMHRRNIVMIGRNNDSDDG